MEIQYRMGVPLNVDDTIELYRASTLGARRPVDDHERMKAMLESANLIVTAWDGDLIVGISRSLTDFVYATYLADLAVRESHQKMGIGRELVRYTREAAPQANLILLAAPLARGYYPKIGFTAHDSAWVLYQADELK